MRALFDVALRIIGLAFACKLLIAAGPATDFVRHRLQLSDGDVLRLEQGLPVSYELRTPDKAEVLVYGAVRIRSTCEAFVSSYADVEKLADGKSYLQVRKFSSPPQAPDLADLVLDREDLRELRDCRPGDCEIQMPASLMEQFRKDVNWDSDDAEVQAKGLVAQISMNALAAYRKGGNQALGEYNDKAHPARIAESLRAVIGRARDLPVYFPEFYRYLVDFPAAPPPHTRDFYYWENVKFGLKPTFRINHVSIYQPSANPGHWLIANKQLYASHYFQAAIDLSLCVRDDARSFYLLTLKGSRQDGLTGPRGGLLRRVVTARAREGLTMALQRLKERSESGQ
ncbi:MAG: hypothetical protein IT165_12510 [Bryobacterales bacterium]|nr:hypothetical protein [Bryobacterales bacterium]